jgi:hypothetical protein
VINFPGIEIDAKLNVIAADKEINKNWKAKKDRKNEQECLIGTN